MLKKFLLPVLLAPILVNATTMTALLQTLEKRPEATLDALDVQKGVLSKELVNDQLYPTVNLFGSYEKFSTPTGLLPVPPNELFKMIQDPAIPQPFSEDILRGGASFSWPVFVKSIYTMRDKASLLHLAAKDKKYLNLLQRQAMVVGSVAQLRYLEALRSALDAKKRSINETQTSTQMKVENGRAPNSALLVLESTINDLDIAINDIDQKSNTLCATIETVTAVELKKSVPIGIKRNVRKKQLFALLPLEKKLNASKKDLQAASESYYPSLVAKGNYAYSNADAYNNAENINERYGSAGLYLSMPLFDKSKNTAVEQAKVEMLKEKSQIEKTKHDLVVQTSQLEEDIRLLEHSIALAKKSVDNQHKLLKIAKVSLENESITQEEYLRYEDALANAKASFYSFEAKRIQDIAQLAVIYGNDLREIVK